MKKKIVAWLTLVFILITSVSVMIPSVAAENVSTARKFNVVFVVDASNSMNATDSQGWLWRGFRSADGCIRLR